MASGIDVKMGVSGLSQFKTDINSAKQSLKTLDEQLALTEKEYKATGDAETYMQRKTEQLQSKLDEQKRIVENASKALEEMRTRGVDTSSKSFQEMLRTLTKAKGEMLDTQTELKNLGSSAGQAKTDTEQMNAELKNIGKGVSWENVTDGLGKIISKLENGARAAINFGKKVASSAMDSTAWADEILTTATKYGMDADTVQRMRNVSEFIDTDVDTILNARSRLAKNKGNLAELLGINAEGMSVEDAFWKAGAAIQGMTDEFQKEEAAQKVFGRGWHELVPLFTAGQEKYNELMAEQNVLSNEQVESLGKADDAFKQIQQQVELMKNQFWAENADKITELLQWIIDNKEGVVGAVGAIGVAFGALKLGEMALNVAKLIDGFKKLGVIKEAGSAVAGAGKAGMFSGISSTVAANGLSTFAPAAVIAAAIAPALIAQAGNERTWAAQRGRREAAAGNLTGGDKDFLLAAAAALDQHYQLTGDSAAALMGLKDRGTVEKARLFSMLSGKATSYGNYATDELLRFWNGEGDWDQARTDALLTTITDSYAKMAEATEAITGGTDSQKQSSSEMTAAAGTLKGMPGAVEAAIIRGMSGIKIYIDGQQMGNVVSPYVNSALAGVLMSTGIRG